MLLSKAVEVIFYGVKLYVGQTDLDWYRQLSEEVAEEANFWKPGSTNFRALEPGSFFLFKLKSPHNRIVGGGHFLRFLRMPVSLAWRTYEWANGVQSIFDFRNRIVRLLPDREGESDPEIGCILLNECFWLPYDKAIPLPDSFHPKTVQGRSYDLEQADGKLLFESVMRHLNGDAGNVVRMPEIPAYGAPYEAQARLGQAGFRALVIEGYLRRCAITGERTLPALDAAHIQPYSVAQKHELRNGLLLRADLHKLFDEGLITITDEQIVEVSSSIKERWDNGRIYYALHGQPLTITPSEDYAKPSLELLRWHNENVFVP